ncbi:MAG: ribonuclease P protein component [Dysgonamonadaceae bacterium]|nr:ribonuclease P protein component [Dysgonamonadaceae bacterium]
MNLRQTFSKSERISSQKEIDFLFSEGNSFPVFPLRVIYAKREKDGNNGFSVLISVPKKKIKRAVHRNRLKRLIREAYRLNKHLLAEGTVVQSCNYLIAFIYVTNEMILYKEIETALIKGLTLLKEKLQ